MKKKIIDLLQILLGNAFMAFAVNTLILENGIVCGGVSGIGSALEHYFNMPLSLTVAILNIILFFLGAWTFGKGFAMSIIISTFAFPVFLELFDRIPVLHGYLEDPLLSMVIGGCLVGIGIGIVIKANASTGGVDILAQFIAKKFSVPVHVVLNVIDVSILVLQISYSDTTNIIYGIIMTFVTSAMLKRTLLSGRSLIQLTVMSDKHEEIREMILNDMDAGVTMMMSEKGYTRKESKLLTSVIPYQKLPKMKEKIQKIDPMAFIIVAKIEEVGGQGFSIERQYE
jgi:uncharacterized membrane-anchored protein YitT (DUF2179 family)